MNDICAGNNVVLGKASKQVALLRLVATIPEGDQLCAPGLVLNVIVLFNTRYINAAIERLRSDGYPVLDEDVARLSPFARSHVNMQGRYLCFPLARSGRGPPRAERSQ